MLQSHECYRIVTKVDVEPVLKVLDKLEFVDSKGECAWVTKPGSHAPEELLQLVRSSNLGGIYKRMFCRKLMPHQHIPPHVDDHDWMREGNIRRFQIPIQSHPDIKMRWPDENVEVYLEPGFVYEVAYWKKHEVIHNADVERIHIQIDMEF